MIKKKLNEIALVGIAIFMVVFAFDQTNATVIAFQHSGTVNPTTEGFSYWPWNGDGSTTGISNDLGYDAIQISSFGTQQLWYQSTADITDQALNEGWTLHSVARVVGGLGEWNGSIIADFGIGKRFDISLSLDSNGDIVVGLNTSVSGSHPFQRTGPTYTLDSLGDGYHTYDLSFDPIQQVADLYVDGILRISGYEGFSYPYVSHFGAFGAVNNGAVNFNEVSLAVGSPVPVPGTLWLFSSTIGIAIFGRYRRLQIRKNFHDWLIMQLHAEPGA